MFRFGKTLSIDQNVREVIKRPDRVDVFFTEHLTADRQRFTRKLLSLLGFFCIDGADKIECRGSYVGMLGAVDTAKDLQSFSMKRLRLFTLVQDSKDAPELSKYPRDFR